MKKKNEVEEFFSKFYTVNGSVAYLWRDDDTKNVEAKDLFREIMNIGEDSDLKDKTLGLEFALFVDMLICASSVKHDSVQNYLKLSKGEYHIYSGVQAKLSASEVGAFRKKFEEKINSWFLENESPALKKHFKNFFQLVDKVENHKF